jgi:DNA-binding beta-propeller fold protein YncE
MPEQTFPQLSFAINNKDAAGTIYITTDPTVNQLSFTIATNTASTVFTPGQLVPPAQAPTATGSILYLDLSPLQIPASDFAHINCVATGWQSQSFPNSIIAFTVTDNTTINPGDLVTIAVNNLVLPNPPSGSSVNLSVSYYRVDPITIGNMQQQSFFKELLQAAPAGHADLHAAIACVLTTDNTIVTSDSKYPQVSNSISFAFQPGPVPATVVAASNTTFTVSFVYAPAAPGYGALTTPQSASATIQVKQGQNAAPWTVTPNADAQNPSWIIAPPEGQPIIGSGTASFVQFDISNIETEFEAGPTLMYVQYANVPGFNPGAYTILLNKVAHVDIVSLTAVPNPAVLSGKQASVNISWQANNYTSLMLMPFYRDVTNQTSFNATLKNSTVVTLVATGGGTSANQATMAINVDVLPVINSFSATPTNIYYNDYPHAARFAWDVDTNDTVYLVNDNTGSSEIVPASSILTKSITAPGNWTLLPQNSDNPLTLQRTIQIQSYKISPEQQQPGFTPTTAVASPSAEFIAVVNTSAGNVAILNALDYSAYTSPLATGVSPVDAAFTNDGNYLFVANASGSLTIIRVSFDPNSSTYNFIPEPSLTIPGSPARIAVSDDDNYIFVSVNNNGVGNLVVISNGGNSQFSIKQTITIGHSPGGIATDPSGVHVYVTNALDNTVSVIGYSSINDAFVFARNITGLLSNPVDVAVADPLGQTLLVVCAVTNTLVVVDYDDQGSSPRQELTLGNAPARIVTTKDRAYAFVTNTQSNTTSLVSCYNGTGNCSILESGLKTGNRPGGLSVAYDDTAVYVSNDDNSITQLDLVNYQMQQQPINTGNQLTSVIASPDNSKVVMWHNITYMVSQSSFSPGLFIYETGPGTVVNKLATTNVIKCVFSPSTQAGLMYMVQQNTSNISILETQKFTIQSTIPIPLGVGGVLRYPVELAMSVNAQNLYTVVKDSSGNYSFLAYTCNETAGTYTVTTDVQVFTNRSTSNPILLAITPDATNAYIVSTFDQKIWNLQRGQNGVYTLNQNFLPLNLLARTMVASPDNTKLYILSQQNMNSAMTVVNTANFTSVNYPFPSSYSTIINFQQMVISPDGSRLFISDADIAGVRIMSTTTLRIIQTLSWQQNIAYPFGITMLSDASVIYLTGYNSGNMATIKQIQTSGPASLQSEAGGQASLY